MSAGAAAGPLAGLRVLEFEAIGPGPFCGMLLADLGADVLLVDRAEDPGLGLERHRRSDALLRGRRSVTLDLKRPDGVAAALALAERADALIEGFRPGVMERLGLGPDAVQARNARLVYGRMTGWGQTGPLAPRAGHDIDYIARSGVLHAIGRAGEAPVPPLNLVGDFGGGGLLLAVGLLAALHEARTSGRGQVVDAAMVDGASLLATMFAGFRAEGTWSDRRGTNVLDTGAPWYDVYETADGRHIAVGAIEPRFYGELVSTLGLADALAGVGQHDRTQWPRLRAAFAAAFGSRGLAEWEAVFEGSDACVAPILSFGEAERDAHAVARGAHVPVGGFLQPAPAPRFSRTPGTVRRKSPERGEGGRDALADWGFESEAIAAFERRGMGLGTTAV